MSYLQATAEQRNVGSKWNTPLINAVVLYVGSQAIAQISNQNTSPSQETVAHNAFMDIFQVGNNDIKLTTNAALIGLGSWIR